MICDSFIVRHGNIQGVEGSEWSGIVVHFIITFPCGYPTFPPRVRLCSFVPHLNVQNRQGSWHICLDMLETEPLASTLAIPYQYWSSAFSVRSILVQMTSFLLVDGHSLQVINLSLPLSDLFDTRLLLVVLIVLGLKLINFNALSVAMLFPNLFLLFLLKRTLLHLRLVSLV